MNLARITQRRLTNGTITLMLSSPKSQKWDLKMSSSACGNFIWGFVQRASVSNALMSFRQSLNMRKLVIILALLISSAAMADSGSLQRYFKTEAVKVGGGKYYWKGLVHAYDATLYSADGKFDWNQPYALELTYKTDIDGEDIAVKTLEEMNRISPVEKEKGAKWLSEMKAIFPNVSDGVSLTGVNIPGKGVAFMKNGQDIGGISDPEFSLRFFEIWLSPQTPDKKLRAKLLGEKK